LRTNNVNHHYAQTLFHFADYQHIFMTTQLATIHYQNTVLRFRNVSD